MITNDDDDDDDDNNAMITILLLYILVRIIILTTRLPTCRRLNQDGCLGDMVVINLEGSSLQY